MYSVKSVSKCILIVIAAATLLSAVSSSAAATPRQGGDILLDTYHRSMSRLEKSSIGLPLLVESFERDDTVHVDVYGIFDHPFGSIVNVLKTPSNWCDIVSLHPNVKACTYKQRADALLLTFYLGRKGYQHPEKSHQVNCRFRTVNQQQAYLDIILNADEGPFGTKDHRMRFEAMPLDAGRTFVHVSYAYSDSAALRLVAKIYFATLGRGKVGFTVTGADRKRRPIYIGGPRGAVERSAVRYYVAIQSVMNTMHYPENSRFSMRISEWYDLTTRFRKQLFDLEKKDYVTAKIKEHNNQMTLQRQIGTVLQ